MRKACFEKSGEPVPVDTTFPHPDGKEYMLIGAHQSENKVWCRGIDEDNWFKSYEFDPSDLGLVIKDVPSG